MSIFVRNLTVAAALIMMSPNAIAQGGDDDAVVAAEDLELTMRLLPSDGDRADIITKTITLPPAAIRRGEDDRKSDRGPADDAGNRGQDGRDLAEEARERGREFGQDMAEQARENREDAGRGNLPEDLPVPPDNLPVPPIDPPN